ncbi:expressed hypothetical protein, partial [Trichoplax adhaerens]
VCIQFLKKFTETLTPSVKENVSLIEKEFIKTCGKASGKDNRFCYYLGGTSDAATKILNEITKPISYSIPTEKICEKLKKKDTQICELKYDKKIDLKNVNLKKLRVKDLKKILNNWDEDCKGCVEKTDFIKKIEDLKRKHVEL